MNDKISQLRLPVNRQSDIDLYHTCDMGTLKERLKQRRLELGLTQLELAKKAKVSQTTISDIERGRNQGSTEVATLAFTLGVHALWLAEGKLPKLISEDTAVTVIKTKNELLINQYHDQGGSMGNGVILKDQPGQITGWRVTPEWAEKNLPSNTGKNNLCIVTGFGDSMKGMFNPGDPVIVDTGITNCEHDGVYFFRVGDEGFIKRLQRVPGEGIRVISENAKYPIWVIKPDMDFEVFGKVLKAWNSESF